MTVNGQDYGSSWIPWKTISSGAEIEFVLGVSPNRNWGSQTSAVPPSFEIPNLL